jgi:hypothetical protein
MEIRAGVMSRILAKVILVILICETAQADLISYWMFDEGSGTIAYDSQGSNDGNIYGATWTTGQINGALSFDGSNDYVTVSNNASQQITTNQMSLAAWIKLAAEVGNTQKRIICKQESSGNSWGLELFGNGYGATGNQVNFHDSDGSSQWRNCTSPTHLDINRWYHIAVTDNAGQIRIYINGGLDSSFTNGYGIPSNINAPIMTGSSNPANYFNFNGIIDEVRFYNRALSDEEIEQIYNGQPNYGAHNPNPFNGKTDVSPNATLSWSAGPNAVWHNVYFGTGFNDVNNATTAWPEFKGNQPIEVNYYDPGGLIRDMTYYWRIDEVNEGNIIKGYVWNFMTSAFAGLWRFEETQGNTAYDSVGGNNGTLMNGPAWTAGRIGGAITFDGVDDYVEIPGDNLNLNSQVTISAWINTKSRNARQVIIGQWNYAGTSGKRSILLESRGDIEQRFAFSVSLDGTEATATTLYSVERFQTNTWYHIAATYDGAVMKLYINGLPDNSDSKSGNIFTNDSELDIGSFDYGGDGYFYGVIDDVRIYGRVLSANEVKNLYLQVEQIIACTNSIDPYYWQFNVPDMIHIANAGDVDTMRSDIINYLWQEPDAHWPGDKLPDSNTVVHDPENNINGSGWYRNLDNFELIACVERLNIKMDRDTMGHYWYSRPYLLIAENSINRLLIFQQGHIDCKKGGCQTYTYGTSEFLEAGGKETIDFFLSKGFSIMTFCMPLYGENEPNISVPGYPSSDEHNWLSAADILPDSFIHVFIEPVIVGINFAKYRYNFCDVSMTGISGGGWTTHMCAAVDARIRASFPTAGSLPLFLRQGPCGVYSMGDAEQEWPDLYGHQTGGLKIDGYNSITGWLDVYILGGYGSGRQQVHILNQYDGCCFRGIDYRTYEPYVQDAIEQSGQGAYSVYLDTTHSEHKISTNVIHNVIYPRLQESFTADFTGEGRVDIYDLAIFAGAWLSQEGTTGWNESCDLFDDGRITLTDFAEFAKRWLQQTE